MLFSCFFLKPRRFPTFCDSPPYLIITFFDCLFFVFSLCVPRLTILPTHLDLIVSFFYGLLVWSRTLLFFLRSPVIRFDSFFFPIRTNGGKASF